MRRDESFLAALDALVHRLEDVAQREQREYQRMSETIAMLRAGENFVVLAGMVNIPASLTWGQDFAVPFASVAAADPNGAGPLVLEVDGGSGQSSLGSAQLNVKDFACVPLRGRRLDVVATVAKPIFVAVYTRIQPLAWGTC